ncbi:MAG: DUF192 domain-containing protein [Candidatus Acidiferrales bacterium]
MTTAQKRVVCAFNATRERNLAEHVTLADTFLTRLVGLLGQPPVWSQTAGGLWIVPSHGVHTMGMRFDIDVIFLDRSNRAIHLENSLRPWRISSVIPQARSVLELPPNAIACSGTQLGDQITFKIASRDNQDSATAARPHPYLPLIA